MICTTPALRPSPIRKRFLGTCNKYVCLVVGRLMPVFVFDKWAGRSISYRHQIQDINAHLITLTEIYKHIILQISEESEPYLNENVTTMFSQIDMVQVTRSISFGC